MFVLVACGNSAAFAAAKTFTFGGTNNNWATTNNWNGGTVPAVGDTITIPIGETCIVAAAPNAPSTVDVQGSLTVNSAIAMTASGTVTISGTVTVSGTLTVSAATAFAINGGTLRTAGAGSIVMSNVACVMTESGAGTLDLYDGATAGSMTINAQSGTPMPNTFDTVDFANATITYNAVVAAGDVFIQTEYVGGNIAYYNLTLQNGGATTGMQYRTSSSGTLVVTNTLTVDRRAGAGLGEFAPDTTCDFTHVTINAAARFFGGSFTHTVSGNWTRSGTFTNTGTTITFDGTGNVDATTFNNVIINTGTRTSTGATVVAGTLELAGGATWAMGAVSPSVTGLTTVSGNFTITSSGAGTLTLTGGLAVSGGDLGIQVSASTRTVSVAGAGVTVDATRTLTVNTSVTLNATTTTSISGALVVNGTYTATGTTAVSGTATIAGTYTANSTLTLSGTATVSGTLSATAATAIAFTGGTLQTSGASGAITVTNISGVLTESGTSVLDLYDGANAGSLTFNATSGTPMPNTFDTVDFANAGVTYNAVVLAGDVFIQTQYAGGNIAYYDLTLQNGGATTGMQYRTPAAGTLVVTNTLTVDRRSGAGLGEFAPDTACDLHHVTINASAKMFGGALSHTVSGNWTNSGALTANTSTFTFDGGAANINGGAGATKAFNQVIIDCLGATKTLTGALDVDGDLTLTNGTLSAGAQAITLGGAWTNNATFTAGTSTVTLDTGSATITTGGTGAGKAFYNLTVNIAAQTKTLAGNLDVDGTLTITAGTLDVSASNYSINTFAWTNSTGTFTPQGGTVTLDGGAATITTGGAGAGKAFNNLVVNASGTKTTSGAMKVNNDLTLTAATMLLGANVLWTLDVDGTVLLNGGTFDVNTTDAPVTVAGNWTWSSGTFTAQNGTVTFDGGSATITTGGTGAGKLFWNLTVNSSGTKTLAGNLDVNATLTITAGTLDVSASNYTINAFAWTNTSGTFNPRSGTVTFDGAAATITTGGQGAGKEFFDVVVAASAAKTTSGAMKVLNDVTVSSGTFTLAAAVDVDRHVVISGTGTISAGANTMNVGGDWTNGATFTQATSTVIFDGASPTLTTGGTGAAKSFNNLTISVSGTALLAGNLDVDGTLTISSGTLDVSASVYTINAFAWTNSTGTFTPRTGTVTLDLAAATITTGGAGAGKQFYNLTVNATGIKTVSGDLKVQNDLTCTASTLTLGGATDVDRDVIINGGTLSCGANALSVARHWTYSSGTLTAGTGTVTFDTGDGTVTPGGGSFYNVIVDAAGFTKTLGAALTATNDLTLTNGTFDVSATNYGVTVGRHWTNNATFTPRAGTATFNTAVAGTITTGGTGAGKKFWNFTVSAGTKTLSGDLDVDNILNISGGTFDVSASNYNIWVGGNWTRAGTFTSRAGTVTFDGTGSVDATATFNNVIMNVGTRTSTGATGIGGTLELTGSATWALGAQAPTVTGLTTVTGNFTITSSGAATLTLTGGLTVSGGDLGIQVSASTRTVSVAGAGVTVDATRTLTVNTSVTLN
ncbi:MAG: hypothetical protein HY719_09810, partial [Planctomycetes bacterium]|nr:hypothetical protein [Planctomycetota bacterium]